MKSISSRASPITASASHARFPLVPQAVAGTNSGPMSAVLGKSMICRKGAACVPIASASTVCDTKQDGSVAFVVLVQRRQRAPARQVSSPQLAVGALERVFPEPPQPRAMGRMDLH